MGVLLIVFIYIGLVAKAFDYSNDSEALRKSWKKTQNRNNMYGK